MIGFKDLNISLKIIIVYSWLSLIFNVALFGLGFVIGFLGI